VCSLAIASAAAGAGAAEIELAGSRLLVSGLLDGSAIGQFQSTLASGRVRTVVFENAVGGSAELAIDYARAVQAAGVDTEVRGQCQAACAYAFLAGKAHRFGHGFKVHALLIPLPGRPRPEELAQRWRADGAHKTLAEFIAPADASPPLRANASSGSAGAAPAAAEARSMLMANTDEPAAPAPAPPVSGNRWRPGQGVLFTSTPTLFGRVNNSFYCDGTQGRDLARCELLPDADPYKLGVLSD
jgi:hypothetical protein